MALDKLRVPPTAALMTKLLGAQTVVTCAAVTHDHEALFAFALAGDGVAVGYDEFKKPEPEQLAWAVLQIEKLVGKKITEDDGFEPDEIDPAIAVLLNYEGWFLAPEELSFAQVSLEKMSHVDKDVLAKTKKAWDKLSNVSNTSELAEALPERVETIQLQRLTDCLTYVKEHRKIEEELVECLSVK
jgi:hypothetical protein